MVHWLPPSDVLVSLEQSQIHLIDIRPAEQFCQGHPQGALCVPLSQQGLAERVETAAGVRRPVVFLAALESWVEVAEYQIRDAGWTCLGAAVDDRPSWLAAGAQWSTVPEVPVEALNEASRDTETVVLDVREPLEWETGHVPGAHLISLGNLRNELDRIPSESEVTVVCESGLRSATAASILQSSGYSRVTHVPGGTAGYRRSGRPLEYPEIEQERSR